VIGSDTGRNMRATAAVPLFIPSAGVAGAQHPHHVVVVVSTGRACGGGAGYPIEQISGVGGNRRLRIGPIATVLS